MLLSLQGLVVDLDAIDLSFLNRQNINFKLTDNNLKQYSTRVHN